MPLPSPDARRSYVGSTPWSLAHCNREWARRTEVSTYDPHSTGTRPTELGEKSLLARHDCSQVMGAAEACINPDPHAAEDA